MSLWSFPSPLLLASASTARRAMLTDAGIPVDIEPARINERAVDQSLRAAGAPPGKIALALARAKAAAVSAHHPGRLVLGADQLLIVTGRSSIKRETVPKPSRNSQRWRVKPIG